MKIHIAQIPHKLHRYSTCGDWWIDEHGDLQIVVSEEIPEESYLLVALHEFAEWIMTRAKGITPEMVDKFDKAYEAHRTKSSHEEPGDDPKAPYFQQHGLAEAAERIVAAGMGVSWEQHEMNVEKLFK